MLLMLAVAIAVMLLVSQQWGILALVAWGLLLASVSVGLLWARCTACNRFGHPLAALLLLGLLLLVVLGAVVGAEHDGAPGVARVDADVTEGDHVEDEAVGLDFFAVRRQRFGGPGRGVARWRTADVVAAELHEVLVVFRGAVAGLVVLALLTDRVGPPPPLKEVLPPN